MIRWNHHSENKLTHTARVRRNDMTWTTFLTSPTFATIASATISAVAIIIVAKINKK